MTLNLEQAAIVGAISSTVNVVAGAGTGKTFTLTERIVTCVKKMIEERPEIDLPIEHILAITFTEKAASELRSRVRAALFRAASETGDEKMLLCALNTDNAWISTIHGMASRILRENAVDFELDPTFGLISESESDSLLDQALEQAIVIARESFDPLLEELFSTEAIYPSGFNADSIVSDIRTLFSRTSFMPHGLDGVVIAPVKDTPAKLIMNMIEAADKVLPILEGSGWSEKGEITARGHADKIKEATKAALHWIDCNQNIGFEDELDSKEYLKVLHAFPPTTNAYPASPKEFKESFSEYRRTYQAISAEAITSLGRRRAKAILMLAKLVQDQLFQLKAANASHIDKNDLLLRCEHELKDPSNEKILSTYRDKFEYIMIDEFQDTDRLQMSIVAMLARCEGASELSNVCTVGDMQQSIYRFRGADVTLAASRKASLEGSGNQFSLTGNYRSHESVLRAVEKVFSQRKVFGEDFLKLNAKRDEEEALLAGAADDRPRILIDYIDKDSSSEMTPDEARFLIYIGIAKNFKQLAGKGVSPSNMAVLLGRMKNADQVQSALRAVGLESIVTGGSVFGSTAEAHLVAACLDYALNQDDDIALFTILTSDMFSISDDVFLALTRKHSDVGIFNMTLSAGFSNQDTHLSEQLSEDDSFELEFARRLLSDFVKRAWVGHAASALRDLMSDSGLLYRAERQIMAGDACVQASVANISKAIAIVSSLEQSIDGIADLSRKFRSHIETEKEAPGVLNTQGSEFVSIMTVHSSKGLEFDHVAIADVKDGRASASSFVCENVGDSTYLAAKTTINSYADDECKKTINAVKDFKFDDSFEEVSKESLVCANSPSSSYKAIAEFCAREELAEAQRLMYVAMTRARETLQIGYYSGKSAKQYPGIYGDIYTAMQKNFGKDDAEFDAEFYGVADDIGFLRHRASYENLDAQEIPLLTDFQSRSENAQTIHEKTTFDVPLYAYRAPLDLARLDFDREGIHSYSSLAASKKENNSTSCESSKDNVSDGDFADRAQWDSNDAKVYKGDADKATNLGTAFHRLAQMAIINASMDEKVQQLECPQDYRVRSQIESCDLSENQIDRLHFALDLWFNSDIAKQFAQFGRMAAEVPFSVRLEAPNICKKVEENADVCAFANDEVARSTKGEKAAHSESFNRREVFFLEGEIDGLADNGCGGAFLIDYKTGGSADETDEVLYEKHLFQAQCYAYALLAGGFDKVSANFIRVEQPSKYDPCQPQIVKYSFDSSDMDALKDAIVASWRYAIK